jgi:rhomboid protease GluP
MSVVRARETGAGGKSVPVASTRPDVLVIMPVMPPPREHAEPSVADSTPLPIRVGEFAPAVALGETTTTAATETDPNRSALPTAEVVFRAVAASRGPWFPARHAAATGVPREALDEPLAELRVAGLVVVTDWVRGVGQGYALTPAGETLAANPEQVASLLARAAPAPPAEVDLSTEGPRAAGELEFAPPVVVPLLLVLNGLWFAVCASWSIRWGLTPSRALSEGHPEVLHRFGAVSGLDLLAGDWWRLLSSCFVHHGALHLLVNLVGLAMMGPLAELLWGRRRLLTIYLLSGFAGSALAMALQPDSLLAGASGAIWGVHTSLFVWVYAHRDKLPPEVASDWLRRLTVVLVLNVAASTLPRVSWEGHLGGGLVGFASAGLLLAAAAPDRRRLAARVLLALIPFACLGGVAAAMGAKGIPAWQQLKQRERARAEIEFQMSAAPRLAALAPKLVWPVENSAGYTLTLDATPTRTARADRDTARLIELKKAADELDALAGPTGDEARAAIRAYARARSAALGKALELLARPEPPARPAWDAWFAARREADRLWAELAAK